MCVGTAERSEGAKIQGTQPSNKPLKLTKGGHVVLRRTTPPEDRRTYGTSPAFVGTLLLLPVLAR